jgi:transposase-like protein
MNTPPPSNPYKRHRFPAEIISHCVWLYFRFCLSDRDVEELMAARGIILTYEAVRYWCRKFWQTYANGFCQLSRRFDFLQLTVSPYGRVQTRAYRCTLLSRL